MTKELEEEDAISLRNEEIFIVLLLIARSLSGMQLSFLLCVTNFLIEYLLIDSFVLSQTFEHILYIIITLKRTSSVKEDIINTLKYEDLITFLYSVYSLLCFFIFTRRRLFWSCWLR